jgi:NADH-quinone oxidoreductase subunit N
VNSPTIWILFPILVAGIIYLFRDRQRLIIIIAILVSLLLAVLAWQIPLGQPINPGFLPFLIPGESGSWQARLLFQDPSSFRIVETMTIFGRQLVLVNAIRPILALIYLVVAIWIGGSYAAKADLLFVPLGLVIAALLTAALAVRPFLYAALLIELTALISVPILSPPGTSTSRGVIRFLTFQTLGMPFVLLAGWILNTTDGIPLSETIIIRGAILAGIGLAFLTSVFPFHTWIPMVAEESHPYSTGFVLFTLPTVVSLFSIAFLIQYIVPISSPVVWLSLRFLGLLMVVGGGLWCALQVNLGRMLGFAATAEIGLFLLAISLGPGETSLSIALAQILPRGIALAVWALALAVIKNRYNGLHFRQVQGAARILPLAAISLVLAQLSLAGLPLLAGFPVRLSLWTTLAGQSLPEALLALAGSAALMVGGVRTLAVLVTGKSLEAWQTNETQLQTVLFILGWVMLVVVGVLPQLVLGPFTNMALVFSAVP